MMKSIFLALALLVSTAHAAPLTAQQKTQEMQRLKGTHDTLTQRTQFFTARHLDTLKNAEAAKANAERYERLRSEAADRPEHAAVFHALATKERSAEKGSRAYALIVAEARDQHAAEAKRIAGEMKKLAK